MYSKKLDLIKKNRLYVWKKEWARMFESPYSIFRNFCRVNVCKNIRIAFASISKKKIILNASPYREQMLASCIADPSNCLEIITPKWYREFIYKMSKFGNIYENSVVYCPECMKEHYHSVFHNIRGVKKCFIHDCELIKTNIRYNLSTIVYDVDNIDDFNNVKNFILPINRREVPAFYNIKGYQMPQKLNILERKETAPFSYLPSMLFNKNQNPVFEYKPNNFTSVNEFFMCLKQIIKDWKTPRVIDLRKNNDSNKCVRMSLSRFDVGAKTEITDVFEYYLYFKRCKLMEESNIIISLHEKFEIEEFLMKDAVIKNSPEEDFALRYSFIWGIYPVKKPFDAGNCKIVTQYRSLSRSYDNKPYNSNLGNYISNYNLNDSEFMDLQLIQLKILEDEFDLLWEQYKELAARPQGINACSGWKELQIPEYYIIQNTNGIYQIYRNL